jgi:excisionase family DNA binding protein/PAS domain S-box-containing protein
MNLSIIDVLCLAQILLLHGVDMIASPTKSQRKHARVVIMDADEVMVKQLVPALTREGYKVDVVEQTSKLFEKIKNEQVDVLILSVDGRCAKGYELIPTIKKINRFLPIIATSADDSIEMATRVREQGVFFYAIKPLDTDELKLALRNACSRTMTRYYDAFTMHGDNTISHDYQDEILDLVQASKVLKLSKETVRRLARNGDLPASRLGHKWYFIRNQLLEWLRVTAASNQTNFGTLILETMDEGVAVVDKRLKIVSCNSAYLQALDVPRDHIIGEYCYRVSHRSRIPCDASSCPVRQAFKTKRPVKLLHINYDSDGREHYCDVIALPMKDNQGNVARVLEVIRDNTEIYNLNRHLNWIMSFFARECKATLGPVMMNISALADEGLSSTLDIHKRNEMLFSSLCSLKFLHDMIRNYIVSYKGENGLVRCCKKAVDVDAMIITPVIDEFAPVLYKKAMRIEKHVGIEHTVYCDVDLMKIAFSNLINNAAKYGTSGTPIKCFLNVHNRDFELRVFNEGVGISRDKLHDFCSQCNRFDIADRGSTGLGLYVVQMITGMHNGLLEVESGYLVDDKPMTYDEFYAATHTDEVNEQNLKKFTTFILKIPDEQHTWKLEV